jgi:hypothetical protein
MKHIAYKYEVSICNQASCYIKWLNIAKKYLESTLRYCTLKVMINYFISLLMCPYGFQHFIIIYVKFMLN